MHGRKIKVGGAVFAAALTLAGAGLVDGTAVAASSHAKFRHGAKPPIVLGTSLSLTGAIAAECLPVKIGMAATFDAANAAGGIAGHKISDTILDDQSNSTQVAANARTLVSDKVFAISGACDSAEAIGLQPFVTSSHTPWLFPFTAVPTLVTPVNRYIFDAVPLYETQIDAIVKATIQRYGKGSFYAVVVQAPDYQQQLSAVKTAAERGHSSYLGGGAIIPNASDISPTVLQIAHLKPKYLFLNTEAADSVRIINQLKSAGYVPDKIIGVQNLMLDPFVQAVSPSVTSRVVAVSPVPGPTAPQASQCRKAVDRYFPKTAVNFAIVEACATAEATVSALKLAAHHLTANGLIGALQKVRNVSLTPLEPPMTFTAKNHMGVKKLFLLGLKGRTRVTLGVVSA